MSEFEEVHEHLEHVAHEHKTAAHTRTAIIIAIMAAALAITEFAAKDAQTSFLTNHIASSDAWAQYQAKSVRRTVLSSEARELLESLSTTTDSVIKKRIADVLANADHMVRAGRRRDGAASQKRLTLRHFKTMAADAPHAYVGVSWWRTSNRDRAGLNFGGHRFSTLHDRQHWPRPCVRDLRIARPVCLFRGVWA